MEDGEFGKEITYYPALKDCRGQAIPKGMDGALGGINDYTVGGKYIYRGPIGEMKDPPQTVIKNTNDFYYEYGDVELPRDLATHLDLIYKAGTNSTNEHGIGGMPIGTPVENAEIVNPAVFGEGGLFDQHGYYRGWVTMDAATAAEAYAIWQTNFYDMDMVTVTIDSGLSEADLTGGLYIENPDSGIKAIEKAAEPAEAAEAAEDAEEGEVAETEIEQEGKRTFRLIKGTEITLPECLYIYDQAETGRGFQSWNAAGETTNETHMPGETFVVMEDVTFTGQWLADGETSVDVVWQDMDDADGLRADALELQVYPDEDPGHVYIQTVTAEEGWRAVLSGDVQRIVPVWEHIDAEAEGGADTAKGYRYEVKSAEAAEVTDEEEEIDLESLIPSGLVLTLVHTPQATIPASGTISWDDDENRDGLRPESVTLRLMNGEEELDSQTVTAENEWKFDFGEVAAYEDGQIVTYTLAEDEIEGYGSADTQMTAADETEEAGFTVPNVHTPKTVNMNGSVIWEDNGNAEARPQSVTVRLLANGEVVSALTVTPDGASTKLLDVPADDETEGETTEGAEAEAEANADDAAETEDATQRADNIWAWSFTGVPVYSEGSEVNYAVEQDRVPGYTTETVAQNGTWFTNIAMPATIALSFDANGGSGEMASVEVDPRHEYTLPECGFTAPEGAEFIGWLIRTEAPEQAEAEAEDETEAEAESASALNPGDVIVVSADTTVIAQWQEAEADLEEISVTVTLKVVNGAWSDGTREDKTIILTGKAGDELRLNFEDLTEMSEPDEGYTLGDWDPQLPFYWAEEDFTYGDPITEDTTYTYTYAPIEDADTTEEAEAVSVTVTLKVVNGAWGDGTREDRIITLTGSEGDELRLQFEDIPEITAPDEGYKMGAWDPELSFYWAEDDFTYGDPITEDTTYTYTYAPIEEPAEQPASAQTWMVLFYENGGEGEMEGATVQDQGSFTLPENGYTAPEGTTFAGWLVGEEVHQPGDEVTIGEDTVIMAQWQTNEPAEQPVEGPAEQPVEEPAEQPANAQTRMVLFYENGGEGEMEGATVQDQGSFTLPENGFTAPEDSAFAGWLVGDEVHQPGDEVTIGEDTVIVAQWQTNEPVEPAEQPAEEPAEQPAEEPVEQPAEEPAEQPAEEPAEQPASGRMYTITFNGGGADGEMEALQAEEGTEIAMPECGYTIEGCTFDGWALESANGGEAITVHAGDKVLVDADMTATACWLWDETAEQPEAGAESVEEEGNLLDSTDGASANANDEAAEDGLQGLVIDSAPEEVAVEPEVVEAENDVPSEVGSVFSGAGIAAIIAAAILVIAAAGIALSRKKRR